MTNLQIKTLNLQIERLEELQMQMRMFALQVSNNEEVNIPTELKKYASEVLNISDWLKNLNE